MLPYQAVAMDYAVSSSFQRHQPSIGLGVNINPAFTHSWFVPADLCVPYKQTPLLEPGHVNLLSLLIITLLQITGAGSQLIESSSFYSFHTIFQIMTLLVPVFF